MFILSTKEDQLNLKSILSNDVSQFDNIRGFPSVVYSAHMKTHENLKFPPSLQKEKYSIATSVNKHRSASPRPLSPLSKERYETLRRINHSPSPDQEGDDESKFLMKKILVPRGDRFKKENQGPQKQLYYQFKKVCQYTLPGKSLSPSYVQSHIDKEQQQSGSNFEMIAVQINNSNITKVIDLFCKESNSITISNILLTPSLIDQIVHAIKFKSSKLQKVILVHIKMNDMICNHFISQINWLESVRILDLSLNLIADGSCKLLQEFIQSIYLFEIYLHWNLITGDGAELIMNGVMESHQLKVLDLSCNLIGKQNSTRFALTLSKYLMQNNKDGVIHLDISNNSIKHDDCLIIQEGLDKNRSLIGVHVFGNDGFIINQFNHMVKLEGLVNSNPFVEFIRINSINLSQKSRIYVKQPLSRQFALKNNENRDTCWICEGWLEIEVQIDADQFGQDSIYVHLSFLQYRPIMMVKDIYQNRFFMLVMCPPISIIQFCFTTDKKQIFLSDSYKIQDLENELKIFTSTLEPLKVQKLNYIKTAAPREIIGRGYAPRIIGKPRDLNFVKQESKITQIQSWNLRESIFKPYVINMKLLMYHCMNHDFDQIRDQMDLPDEVVHIIPDYYYAIYTCYSNLICIGTKDENNLNVDMESLKQLLHDSNILSHSFGFSHIVKIIRDIQQENYQKHTLERYEFIQLLIQCADELYLSQGTSKNIGDAFTTLIDQGLGVKMAQFTSPFEFKQQFWTQDMEILVNHYEDFLFFLFRQALKKPQSHYLVAGYNFIEFSAIINSISNSIRQYVTIDVSPKQLKLFFYYTIIDKYFQLASDEQEGFKEIPLTLDKMLLIEALFRFFECVTFEGETIKMIMLLMKSVKKKNEDFIRTSIQSRASLPQSKRIITRQGTKEPASSAQHSGSSIKEFSFVTKIELLLRVLYFKFDDSLLTNITVPQLQLFPP